MKFISSYDERKRATMPESDGIEDVYEKQVDKFGAVTYVKTGERNLYEEIQSYKDDCDINFIIARCVKDGTVSLLADNGKGAVDVSKLPDNFLDLWNLNQKLTDEFMKLPVEERALFNHSPQLYVDHRVSGIAMDEIEQYHKKVDAQKQEVQSEVENG